MKIAVISDIHDNEVRLKEVIEICLGEKISTAICCGDVTSLETLEILAKGFKKVYVAFGNGDFKLKNLTGVMPENVVTFGNVGVIEIERKKLAFCHYDWLAGKLFESKSYDFVFYGHTHTPWEKRSDGKVLLNPGEVAGQFGKATFAIFDIKTTKSKLVLVH